MSRSNPRRSPEETERLAAVERARSLALHNAGVARERLRQSFMTALATGGEAAGDLWQAERARLVSLRLLAPDVVITPSAWTPRPAPFPHPEPLPPTPTALEAARVAAALLSARPRMTREDYVALGVYIARLNLLHRELGWEE